MKFDKLNETIPHVIGKALHVLEYMPYERITLKFPGKHQADTNPPGGDFVVCVTDTGLGWVSHQFTHGDLFAEFERRKVISSQDTEVFMHKYARVVLEGEDPEGMCDYYHYPADRTTLRDDTLLYALQCLAIAEHRRYAQFEKKGGGRYLPARFASGIVLGHWTAAKAAEVQKMGRPGVEMLEKQHDKRTLDEWVML